MDSTIDAQHLVADVFHQMKIVGYHQNRHSNVIVEMMQQTVKRHATPHVKSGHRFVQKKQIRIIQKSVRDQNTLEFSTGQFAQLSTDQVSGTDLFQLSLGCCRASDPVRTRPCVWRASTTKIRLRATAQPGQSSAAEAHTQFFGPLYGLCRNGSL